MSGRARRVPTAAWVGLAVLLYLPASLSFLARAWAESPPAEVLSAVAAANLLLATWAWLMVRAMRSDPANRRRYGISVAVVLGLLTALAAVPALTPLAAPALVVMVPATLIGITRVWRWVVVLLVWPMLGGELYFGVVLVLIGVITMPRDAGSYLRELFPRRVGGAT